jgi:hypothetical protein
VNESESDLGGEKDGVSLEQLILRRIYFGEFGGGCNRWLAPFMSFEHGERSKKGQGVLEQLMANSGSFAIPITRKLRRWQQKFFPIEKPRQAKTTSDRMDFASTPMNNSSFKQTNNKQGRKKKSSTLCCFVG